MRKWLAVAFVIMFTLASCSTPTPVKKDGGGTETPIVFPSPTPTTGPTDVPSTTEPPPSSSTPEPKPDRYNFLLLGGDFRKHRAGTGYGDKTDVMLLVSIVMDDPVHIAVMQFPRNFYHEVKSFDDMWLFHIYGREGFAGLHYYFQQVYDVDLNGIAYIHMDNFVAFVDDLGGIWLSETRGLDGVMALEYLRDNPNNWEYCNYYDCEGRQFKVLLALAEKVKVRFREDPLTTARIFWKNYKGLFETDLSEFEQFHWLVELGWTIATSKYEISFDRVTMSGAVEYGDTPLEVRGWIVTDLERLQDWFHLAVGG